MITFESIISALLFYLFPTLVGRVAFAGLYKNRQVSYPLISYFILGSLTIFGWALIDKYLILPFFPAYSFIDLFKPTLYILGGLAIFVNLFLIRKYNDLDIRKYIQPFLLSLFLAGIVYFFWQYNTPYLLNWDFLEHQTLVNNILMGKYSFVTSQISDTFIFNGYSSILHTLIAASQIFLPVGIVDYWLSISFIHLVLGIFASYLLALVVTDNENIALLSAILGTFIFETITFTSLFFIPQTLTAVTFVFLFIQLLLEVKHNRFPKLRFLALNAIFLILNHYVIGLIAIAFYLGVYLYIKYGEWLFSKVSKAVLVEAGVIGGMVLVLFSSLIPLGFLNSGEAQFFNFTVIEKFSFMQRAYGYSLLLFLPIGASYILKRKRTVEMIILAVTASLLFLVLIQIPYAFKFYVLGRFFVHLVMAMGIYSLLSQVTFPLLSNLVTTFLIPVMMGIFIVNSVFWKNALNYKDILTHISPNELKAAEFLKERYGKEKVLLVSDPATQNILETFSGINSQGGAYANQNTREQLISISQASSPPEIREKLYKINDTLEPTDGKRIFILSGRYFQWQMAKKSDKEALYFNIWTPSDLTFADMKYIQFLQSDSRFFTLVYENPTVAIFEANNQVE